MVKNIIHFGNQDPKVRLSEKENIRHTVAQFMFCIMNMNETKQNKVSKTNELGSFESSSLIQQKNKYIRSIIRLLFWEPGWATKFLLFP